MIPCDIIKYSCDTTKMLNEYNGGLLEKLVNSVKSNI